MTEKTIEPKKPKRRNTLLQSTPISAFEPKNQYIPEGETLSEQKKSKKEPPKERNTTLTRIYLEDLETLRTLEPVFNQKGTPEMIKAMLVRILEGGLSEKEKALYDVLAALRENKEES